MELDLQHLTNLIVRSCSGTNYFVCVSPYTPKDISRGRIDLFVDHFRNKFNTSFNLIESQEITNGDPTMVLRIFEVEL